MNLFSPNAEDPAPTPTPTAFLSHSRLSCTPCRAKKQRCDRTLPVCDRCNIVGLTCLYPSARKSHVGKPKQVRDLEAKLLQLETRLNGIGSGSGVSDSSETVPAAAIAFSPESTPAWIASNSPQPDRSSSNENDEGYLHDDGLHTQLDSPLNQAIDAVSVDLLEQLTTLYFDKCYAGSPMIHRSRYMSSLRSGTASQPPLFLQYAIIATSANIDGAHESLATSLYRQARSLAEADEIKESELYQPSVAHAQCWLLLANIEAQNGIFSLAYLSLARSIRFAQMLNLHQLDRGGYHQSLFCHESPPRDWTELEERRRTWWVIYVADRLVFSTSGMPPVINDRHVHTLLPVVEEAFEQEREEQATSLQDALRQRSMPESSLAIRVIASHLYYRAIDLESQLALNNSDSDSESDDEFWAQQQAIDKDLMFVVLQLPQHLRLPRNSNGQCTIFINVLLHTANMCLHKTVIRKSRGLDGRGVEFVRRQSQSRMLAAAGQILAIFHLSQHLVETLRNPIQDYAAYIAALMFLEDFAVSGNRESRENVTFLFNVLDTSGRSNPVARMLAGQLTAKLEELGIPTRPDLGEATPSMVLAMDTPNWAQ